MDISTLNDSTLEGVLKGHKPLILLFTDGNSLRGDFMTAFKKAAETPHDFVFARIDPKENPNAANRFGIGDKPVMVAWYHGEEVVRRSKPWGADMPLMVEMLQNAVKSNPISVNEKVKDTVVENNDQHKPAIQVETKPVIVTDATFQQEVIDHELPVLVDFWAAWCGPCRQVAPVLEKLAEEYAGKVRIAKVDVDANPGLSQAFQITSIPTIMMIKQRTMVFNQPGALPEPAFRDLINQLIALEIPSQPEAAQ